MTEISGILEQFADLVASKLATELQKRPAVKSDRRVFLDIHDLDRWIEEPKGKTNGEQL